MNNNKIFIFVLLFLLVVVVSFAEEDIDWEGYNEVSNWTSPRWPWTQPNPSAGSSVLEWYPVEDWEVEVCREYGGIEKTSTSQIVTTDSIYQLTLSLQGKRTVVTNDSIYEISWYVHPFGGDKINYSIDLIGPEGSVVIAEQTEAGVAGSSGYVVHIDSVEFDRVIMDYDGGTFEVMVNGEAIVEEETEDV